MSARQGRTYQGRHRQRRYRERATPPRENYPPLDEDNLTEWFRRRFKEDDFFGPIVSVLKKQNPTNLSDLAAKLLDSFFLNEKEVVCRIIGDRMVICIPRSLVHLVLRECHDLPTAGHEGITKTTLRAKKSYWWPTMYSDIQKYVKACVLCAKHKGARVNIRQEMGAPGFPTDVWQRIHIDNWSVGGTTRDGYTVVLGVIDAFSKFIILIPLRNHQAKTITEALMEHVFLRYGLPDAIHSDGGSEFTSTLQKRFLQAFGVKRKITTPARPQANGVIERIFRTIKPAVAIFCRGRPHSWPSIIPNVAFAYNTSFHVSVGNTPFYLMHGRDAAATLYWNLTERLPLSSNPLQRLKILRQARSFVASKLLREHRRQKSYYDRFVHSETFEEGDVVLVRVLKLPADVMLKLYPKYTGPFRVYSVRGAVLGIRPLHKPHKPLKYVHSDHVKKCDKNCVFDDQDHDHHLPFLDAAITDRNLDQELDE